MEITTQLNDEFRLWLQSELMGRCNRNPRYTLRSFAALLEMDSSTVSQLISGKRRAARKVINRICKSLGANPKLQYEFLEKASRIIKTEPQINDVNNYQLMSDDAIEVLSNWYYFAILEIINIDNFQSSFTWIANRLSLTASEVKIAIERLTRLNLLKIEDNQIKRTEKFLTTYIPGQTTSTQKEFQKQVLRMALDAIDDIPIELRDMTNMTMSIDIDKIAEAKKMITKFRRELCTFLEDGERTRVFQLGIQLYPISK